MATLHIERQVSGHLLRALPSLHPSKSRHRQRLFPALSTRASELIEGAADARFAPAKARPQLQLELSLSRVGGTAPAATAAVKTKAKAKAKKDFRASAVSGSDAVLLEGELLKRSTGLVKRWQKRYFAVAGHYLKYADSEQAVRKAPKATVDAMFSAIDKDRSNHLSKEEIVDFGSSSLTAT